MRYEKLERLRALAVDGTSLDFMVNKNVFLYINKNAFSNLIDGDVIEIIDDTLKNGYFSVKVKIKDKDECYSMDIPKSALKLMIVDELVVSDEESGQDEGGELSEDSGRDEEDSG